MEDPLKYAITLSPGERNPVPKCFLSYQTRGRRWAKQLKNDLAFAGCQAWFDDDEILAGHPIVTEIIRGIQESDVFILIWNKAASKSVWVSNEILRALHKKSSSRDEYLIIVLRRDATPLPEGLREYKWVKASGVEEYSNVLKMILDSIAEKFGGYVFTGTYPHENKTLYKLQWIHSESTATDNSNDNDVYEETLSMWDIDSGKLISSLNTNCGTSSLTVLHDDVLLASLSFLSDDPDEPDLIAVSQPDLQKISGVRGFSGEESPWCVRTSPRRDYVAVTGGSQGGNLLLYDQNLNLINRANLNTGTSLAWSAPERLFVPVLSEHGAPFYRLLLLNIPTCEVLEDFGALPIFPFQIVNLTADLEGKYVVCSGSDRQGGPGVHAIELSSGCIFSFRLGDHYPSSCVSPDGKLLAWVDVDNKHISIAELPEVKLPSIPEAKILNTFRAHARRISALAFDPSSQFLATGCLAGYIFVWKIATFERIAKFKVAQGVEDLLFTTDSRRLVVANTHHNTIIMIEDYP